MSFDYPFLHRLLMAYNPALNPADKVNAETDAASQSPEGYTAASPIPPHPKFLSPEQVCERYLMGVLWTMQMYVSGRCPQYRWLFLGAPPRHTTLMAFVKAQADRAAEGTVALGCWRCVPCHTGLPPIIDHKRFNAGAWVMPC